ncbi:MAG: RsmB/NOP family class I SAM-dependent RNA methyltransferase [Pseudomonadota bacterium]
MTPGARVQAAIDVLDAVFAGAPAEKALTRWSRNSRFAGAKDRAAVRDHVFDALRRRRSAIALGGAETGRAVMLGLVRMSSVSPDTLFNGLGHAPEPLTSEEKAWIPTELTRNTLWNLPDWLADAFSRSLGPEAADTAALLQTRAPVCLRVNLSRAQVGDVQKQLAEEGIETSPVDGIQTALLAGNGARRLRHSSGFKNGLFDFQDAHSQAIALDLPKHSSVLDYCAGGGGKSLALADLWGAQVFAHDVDPARMKDLPNRAKRAGVQVRLLRTPDLVAHRLFDVVLCDAPCSGSGSWRRTPEAKWTLTPERLAQFCNTQDAILMAAARLVAPGGLLAFATCSVLQEENEARVDSFLARHPAWRCIEQKRLPLSTDADGFFLAQFKR